jgi:glutaredoxin
VEFEYRDVQSDPTALRELAALKSQSTPTIVVGEEVMVGFDPERLEQMLVASGEAITQNPAS